ncbi:site-specific integrase [Aerococcus tenax]|uniref:Site-specific integrase n=2 Tax=Aerococcaceae TaxID=186827 RepID=A0A329PH24_9LACT|nr:site-specific integrase [Aerococcus urinae]RAV94098.1 site-specific integrase [Aerococcus mictus]RAV94143.1 site-specific integrase [Aerococcus mictus]
MCWLAIQEELKMTTYKYKTKKGEDRWGCKAYLGTDIQTGKQVNCYKKGFKTEAQAVKYLNQERVKFEAGEYKFKVKDYTFNELYEAWLERYSLSVKPSTLYQIKSIFKNHILPVFSDQKIKNITPSDIETAADTWNIQYKNYQRIYVYLNRILEWAVYKKRWLKENPCKFADLPNVKFTNDKKIRFYSKEELNKVLRSLEANAPYKWYVFFRLLAYTGLRRGEALALTWEDISFSNQVLSVSKNLSTGKQGPFLSTPKTKGSIRTISLDAITLKCLRKWKLEQAEYFLKLGIPVEKNNQVVFTSSTKNKHLYPTATDQFFRKFCKKYDLRFINVHGFRHTHCSLLFEAGVPMKDVKERLGHSNITTTMNIYTHVTKDSRKESADKFAAFMEN